MARAEDLVALGTPADGDIIVVLDVSTTTGQDGGRRLTLSELATYINGHSSNSGTPPVSSHQRYGAYGADATFSAADMQAGVGSTNNDLALTGATGSQFLAFWSAQALTFISNPAIFENTNLISTTFTQSRLTIGATNGYLYVSSTALSAGAINQTWEVR